MRPYALRTWWQELDHEDANGEHLACQGGALIVEPVDTEGHMTLWIASGGQDAFDSIAASARLHNRPPLGGRGTS